MIGSAFFSLFFFQVNLPKTDNSEPGFTDAGSSEKTALKVMLPSRSNQQYWTSNSAQQLSTQDKLPEESLPSISNPKAQITQEEKETEWPVFFDGEKLLPTTFKEELWKCPFCDHWTNRIRQHLKTHHLAKIPDWAAVDNFCNEVSAAKRRRLEHKRTADSKRKESKTKAEERRAADPKTKESKAIAEERRAADPKRKESKAKAEERRAKRGKP